LFTHNVPVITFDFDYIQPWIISLRAQTQWYYI